jgi:D-arginine dehydrogenase
MALTSAASGENYRNWWPHPVMTELTDRSISLMEAIARETGNRIRMKRRGYALATRRGKPEDLIRALHAGYGSDAAAIRLHDRAEAGCYMPPLSAGWENAPEGADVLLDQALIRRTFPSFAEDVAAVVHIRRAGDISAQQLGQYMLERIRDAGGRLISGRVVGIERGARFALTIEGHGAATLRLEADSLVNAAGPFLDAIAAMLGEALPVVTVLQQKIAFPDRLGAIPRTMPFAIDLDGQRIDWTEDERASLGADPAVAFLAGTMPGGIHCRPDGGEGGRWI